MTELEDIAVTKFREYLRINTEQPNPDYYACQAFLYKLADELGIERTSYEPTPGKPIVVMTLEGTEPALPSIMLYSHTDVVPTFRDHWIYDPYAAHKDEHGNIYARGAQDMKCVGSQYFEAIRRLFSRGKKQFRRTIHIVWGPDEEIGGCDGMQKFVLTPEFVAMNVGFSLDEGLANEGEIYKVYYAERAPWWVRFTAKGSPGHGSKFIENTAVEKLHKLMSSALAFRDQEKKKLETTPGLLIGDVTSLNITILKGGVQVNVLPEKLSFVCDIRIPPTVDYEEFEKMLQSWCNEAGEGVTFEYLQRSLCKAMTPTTRENIYWAAFEDIMMEENLEISKEIFIGATDSRFLREMGIAAINFSPMAQTPSLLHDHNEFLNEKVFLKGVDIYGKLIERLADLKG